MNDIYQIQGGFLKTATLEAMLQTSRIGMACKIFKNQHGVFPENIIDLTPNILEAEPLDPFTGKSYIYKKHDAGFIVYSVGSNQKDEDGRGTLRITSLIMEKNDDWSWKEGVDHKE